MISSLKKIAPFCSPDFGRKRIEFLSMASWFTNKTGFSYSWQLLKLPRKPASSDL